VSVGTEYTDGCIALCDKATALGDAMKETSFNIITYNPGGCPFRNFQVNSMQIQCASLCSRVVARDEIFKVFSSEFSANIPLV
jgi:hypothetical protein